MNILVCIKPVPDPDKYGDLRIDPATRRLVREGIPAVINPCDKNALEEALQLRDRFGGSVTVLSMAPEFSRDKMVESLAMGADEAYLLSDAAFGGADTFATSYVLAEGARRIAREHGFAGDAEETEHDSGRTFDGSEHAADETSIALEHGPECADAREHEFAEDAKGQEHAFAGFDLILAGHESADGATSHVPAQLAEWLDLPHICNVKELEVVGGAETGAAAAGSGDAAAGGSGAAGSASTDMDMTGDNADSAAGGDETGGSGFRVRAVRKSEDGDLVFGCPLPAVVAVSRELNKPRLVNAMGIIKARKKPLTIWSNEDLGLDPRKIGLAGSPTQPGELFSPELQRASVSLGTDIEEAVDRILELVRKAGV